MPVGAQFVARPEDEISVSRAGVSLCLLIHRKSRALRIIDFRSGGAEIKRELVLEVAGKHGIQRLFTLVERDEVASWVRQGFRKEGSIVGYYKRTDAHVLGLVVPEQEASANHSGIRRAVQPDAAQQALAEVNFQAARKRAAQLERDHLPRPRVQLARPLEVTRALEAAAQSSRALTSFEPFSRDVQKFHYTCTARGGFSLLVGVETQPCFDNAFVEPLTAPRSDKETRHTAQSLAKICELLTERGIVGCFAMSPVDQIDLAAVHLANGFRRTGNLKGHLLREGRRRDAFLWSQRLAQPSDD